MSLNQFPNFLSGSGVTVGGGGGGRGGGAVQASINLRGDREEQLLKQQHAQQMEQIQEQVRLQKAAELELIRERAKLRQQDLEAHIKRQKALLDEHLDRSERQRQSIAARHDALAVLRQNALDQWVGGLEIHEFDQNLVQATDRIVAEHKNLNGRRRAISAIEEGYTGAQELRYGDFGLGELAAVGRPLSLGELTGVTAPQAIRSEGQAWRSMLQGAKRRREQQEQATPQPQRGVDVGRLNPLAKFVHAVHHGAEQGKDPQRWAASTKELAVDALMYMSGMDDVRSAAYDDVRAVLSAFFDPEGDMRAAASHLPGDLGVALRKPMQNIGGKFHNFVMSGALADRDLGALLGEEAGEATAAAAREFSKLRTTQNQIPEEYRPAAMAAFRFLDSYSDRVASVLNSTPYDFDVADDMLGDIQDFVVLANKAQKHELVTQQYREKNRNLLAQRAISQAMSVGISKPLIDEMEMLSEAGLQEVLTTIAAVKTTVEGDTVANAIGTGRMSPGVRKAITDFDRKIQDVIAPFRNRNQDAELAEATGRRLSPGAVASLEAIERSFSYVSPLLLSGKPGDLDKARQFYDELRSAFRDENGRFYTVNYEDVEGQTVGRVSRGELIQAGDTDALSGLYVNAMLALDGVSPPGTVPEQAVNIADVEAHQTGEVGSALEEALAELVPFGVDITPDAASLVPPGDLAGAELEQVRSVNQLIDETLRAELRATTSLLAGNGTSESPVFNRYAPVVPQESRQPLFDDVGFQTFFGPERQAARQAAAMPAVQADPGPQVDAMGAGTDNQTPDAPSGAAGSPPAQTMAPQPIPYDPNAGEPGYQATGGFPLGQINPPGGR